MVAATVKHKDFYFQKAEQKQLYMFRAKSSGYYSIPTGGGGILPVLLLRSLAKEYSFCSRISKELFEEASSNLQYQSKMLKPDFLPFHTYRPGANL
jgi:hypothetical protein